MTVDITYFKNKLIEEQKSLVKELARHGRVQNVETGDWVATVEAADNAEQDPTAEADRMESISSNVATLSSLEARYVEVKKALERIENNTYGKCVVSGKEIETERLEANPAATTCIEHIDN